MLTLNILTWVFLAIMLISVIAGLAMGFVRTIFSTFSLVIVLVAATIGGPQLSNVIQKSWVGEQIRVTIEEALFQEKKNEEETASDKVKVLNDLNLPEVIREVLEKDHSYGEYAQMETEELQRVVSSYLTKTILNGVCFALIAFVVWVFLTVIVIGLDLVAKLPVLHTMNHLGGLLIGFVRGYLILWIFCAVITALSGTGIGSSLYQQINESAILSVLFNTNLPIRLMNTFIR